MPVQGLPRVLEATLEILLESEELSSWSVFQDKNGITNVRIRFSGGYDGQGVPNLDTSKRNLDPSGYKYSSFKRKSPKQQTRDLNRARKWAAQNSTGSQSFIAAGSNLTVLPDCKQKSETDYPNGDVKLSTNSHSLDVTCISMLDTSPPELTDTCILVSSTPSMPLTTDSISVSDNCDNISDQNCETNGDHTQNVEFNCSSTKSRSYMIDSFDSDDDMDILCTKSCVNCNNLLCSDNFHRCYICNLCEDYVMCTFCWNSGVHQNHRNDMSVHNFPPSLDTLD